MEFVVVIVSVESGVAKILKKIIAVIECRQTKTESVTYQLDCSVIFKL